TFDRASLAFVPLTSLYPYPFFFCLVKRLQPTSTLFPYTTLFRSGFRNRRPHRAAIVAVIGVRQMSWVSWVCAWPHLEPGPKLGRSEEHTSELQSRRDLVCRLLLEKKKDNNCNGHINEGNTRITLY